MAILMMADIPGQTKDGYDGLLAALGAPMRQAKGFIAHFAAETDTGWQCMELWDTSEDATNFFAAHVKPNLPEGIKPKRTLTELHSLVRR